jgi:UDPglucose 6-dehydrogenase
MNITIIGVGYVGLTNALYLSSHHHVFGYDVDFNRINELQQGEEYFHEEGFARLLKKNKSKLSFVHDPSVALQQSEVAMLTVSTPEGLQGAVDLTSIHDGFATILKDGKKGILVIIRSTVPPGTQAALVLKAKKHKRGDISIVSIPEFLSLGQALKDMANPSRVVVGLDNDSLQTTILTMFNYPKSVPFLFTNPQSAELIKYASNAFLATKVSFINEMSQIAEVTNANIDDVAKGMALDPRIGENFLKSGIGFGGSCFPKDLNALQHVANQHNIKDHFIEATIKMNQQQITRFMNRVLDRFQGNIKQKKIAVLGLSYKGSTSDVRNSPAFKVIDMLTDQEAIIFAYDRYSTFDFFQQRGEKPCLAYAVEWVDALQDADVAIILNDAPEIQALQAKDFIKLMKTPIVFDGRNLFQPSTMKGVEYHSIGRPSRQR